MKTRRLYSATSPENQSTSEELHQAPRISPNNCLNPSIVHAYLHADDPTVLPLGEDVLDGLQFGGKRNDGYGEAQLKDTKIIELDELNYSQLKGAETYLIELVTPFVLESEYPDANNTTVPWWWAEDRGDLRLRQKKILEQRKIFQLETVNLMTVRS